MTDPGWFRSASLRISSLLGSPGLGLSGLPFPVQEVGFGPKWNILEAMVGGERFSGTVSLIRILC